MALHDIFLHPPPRQPEDYPTTSAPFMAPDSATSSYTNANSCIYSASASQPPSPTCSSGISDALSAQFDQRHCLDCVGDGYLPPPSMDRYQNQSLQVAEPARIISHAGSSNYSDQLRHYYNAVNGSSHKPEVEDLAAIVGVHVLYGMKGTMDCMEMVQKHHIWQERHGSTTSSCHEHSRSNGAGMAIASRSEQFNATKNLANTVYVSAAGRSDGYVEMDMARCGTMGASSSAEALLARNRCLRKVPAYNGCSYGKDSIRSSSSVASAAASAASAA